MKIERSLILIGIFLVILSIVQAAPILPLVVRGGIEINEQDADIGTNIIAKIDNIEKGSAIVKDKGSYIILVNGEIEDEGKTVEFYINGIKADQTAIFKSGGVIDLDLSLNIDLQPEQSEPQPESYETNSEDNDEDDETSTLNKKRKREEQPEEIEATTENSEEKTITLASGVEKEPTNKKIREETPITKVISTNPSQPRLWQGITVMFILILIGLGIYFSIFKKRAKFQQNGGERLK